MSRRETARRLDLRRGVEVHLIDLSVSPPGIHEVRARVKDLGGGVRVDDGRMVANDHSFEVRMSEDTWPQGFGLPDATSSPSDRLRLVRGDVDPEDDLRIQGSPVMRVRRPAGVVVLEVDG